MIPTTGVSIFIQSLRMTLRDWRAGELRFLLVALALAVASLAAVGFFVDRMRTGLTRDAHQLLGADLVLVSDAPALPEWRAEAARLGLDLAETTSLVSMALAGEGVQAVQAVPQLVSLRAASPGYPLRGRIKVGDGAGQEGAPARGIPEPGTVWIDPSLLSTPHVAVGGMLKLGDKAFRVSHTITAQPDRGASFVNFAPTVLVNQADLAATNLVLPGSRVTYRLLAAANGRAVPGAVGQFQKWLEGRIVAGGLKGVRMDSLDSGRPEMRATLDRAERFLSLVSLLSAMLAAVAVAMAARRFMLRHVDACAMLRFLGLTQNQVTALYLLEFLLLGLLGSVLGALAGFGAHFALMEWLGKFISNDIPPPGVLPALQAVATGMLLLVGFALPPVLQLRNVPHNRVMRREQGAPRALPVAAYLLGAAGFCVLLLWQTGDLKLGGMVAGGFLGSFALFSLLAWLALKLLRPMRALLPFPGWRFALDSLQRRPGATVVQVVALALGLMALLVLTVVRGDLVSAWRASTPADAPNRFVVNILPEQRAAVEAMLVSNGVEKPQLFPMVRGRLLLLNGKPAADWLADGPADGQKDGQKGGQKDGRKDGQQDGQPDRRQDGPEGRARQLLEREFNLSYMEALPSWNTVSSGRWNMAANGGPVEASVEEGMAKALKLKLGDSIGFDVGGHSVEATVTSLRKLEWGSMRANFVVVLSPHAMRGMPQTLITAFNLPSGNLVLGNQLTRGFPNLTVLDIGNMLRQVQAVVDQVVLAVEFLFLFTLASGLLVLYAALMGSQDERTREAGLLRALGATRRQLSAAQAVEFLLVGGLAGALAASGAAVAGWALAEQMFKLSWHFSPWVWLLGLPAGAACALLGGWAGLRGVLRQPPLQTLREG